MPITPTNQTKNTISPINIGKGIGAYWGDSLASWGDSFYAWGEIETYTNQTKNAITPTNQIKN